MYIEKLILTGFRRLLLSDINHFEITPQSVMQLILGRNGSGKSSILAELTPWPAHHSQYAKGGCKEFHCRARGHHYILTSTFKGSGSGHHEFYVDNENLNRGRTYAVQKQLVEQHFGLTKETVDLLTGHTTFTGMTPAKRREWLTQLCPVDLSYAFSLHHNVKTLHRDQQGVVKYQRKRLTREHQDTPGDGALEKQREQKATLTQQLDHLYQQRRDVDGPGDSLEAHVQRLSKAAEKLLKKTPYHIPGAGIESPEALDEALEAAYNDHVGEDARLQQAIETLENHRKEAPAEDATLSDEQIAQLRQERHDLHEKVTAKQTVVDNLAPPLPLGDLQDNPRPSQTLNHLYQELTQLLHHFPRNPDGYYRRETGRQVKSRYEENVKRQQSLEQTLTRYRARQAQLKGCESLVCPNCDHTFVPGVNPNDIVELDKKIQDTVDQLQGVPEQIEADQTYLEELRDYISYVRQFQHLTQQFPGFDDLWAFCGEHKVFFREPRQWTDAFITWYETMCTVVDHQLDKDRLAKIDHQLRFVDALDHDVVARHRERTQALQAEIETRTQRVKEYQRHRDAVLRHRDQLQAWREECQTVLEDYDRLVEHFKTDRAQAYQSLLQEETERLQVQLAQVQENLTRAEVRQGVIDDIEAQHQQAEKVLQEYHVLTKALSPTDGLIGHYLMTFMQSVVQYINAVIARVWTYPMEILPSKVDKDELDYRFPISINNDAQQTGDIAEGSTSQRDIINFAFRLLAMRFLGLQDMPLYLDELGSTFDDQHRVNVVDFLDNFMELDQTQQVFFISHYASTHGAFTNADVCVIDTANVQVPKQFNQHVSIA